MSSLSFGQSNLTEQETIELQELKHSLDGTYQIQMINSRSLPTIELSVFEQIAETRDPLNDTFIEISDVCRVFVPSEAMIAKIDFQPLAYYVIIQTSN